MQNHQSETAIEESSTAAAVGLACNVCRKSKLRCSRDRPACQHCRKTGAECTYETKRVKPGLKAGAIESIHRRLDALENLVNQQNTEPKSAKRAIEVTHRDPHEDSAHKILSLLAEQLPKLISLPEQLSSPVDSRNENDGCSRKRSRISDDRLRSRSREPIHSPLLPSRQIIDQAIITYFSHIHPWIPMIHQRRFRERLDDPRLSLLLHAIIFAVSKFLISKDISEEDIYNVPWTRERSRAWVVSIAMEGLFVENLQALTIVAFTDIGDGNAAKAWSIVGSLTRTVEYMRLTVEHDESSQNLLCQPYSLLNHTEDWTELEERRRVFWNVFLLDRFCSVCMGWNTSLTSDDVHRRLPCDGITWRKEEPVQTPYLGIWDKSAGRIGKPIAFMPLQHGLGPQADLGVDTQSVSDVSSPSTGPVDMSTAGAFAYCIEATESMSRVTSYFLQQRVDLRDPKEINSWLTRFKELDLRLVHWKMLLPEKWKANMERQSTRMDPNLTLAHVTHNVSMILLHQLIAYPPVHWGFRNKLPSVCSADTCFTAAIEITTITRNYLKYTPPTEPTNSQYAFCLFVAARVLLTHWRYYTENQLAPEFWSLVEYLDELSRRWNGSSRYPSILNLPTKFALKLRDLHNRCLDDSGFKIDIAAYMREIDHGPTSHQGSPSEVLPFSTPNATGLWNSMPPLSGLPAQVSNSIDGVIANQLPGDKYAGAAEQVRRNGGTSNMAGIDEFNPIPNAMLEQQFMNLDRVISFDDGSMFTAEIDAGSW